MEYIYRLLLNITLKSIKLVLTTLALFVFLLESGVLVSTGVIMQCCEDDMVVRDIDR